MGQWSTNAPPAEAESLQAQYQMMGGYDKEALCLGGTNSSACRHGHVGNMCQACEFGDGDTPEFYKSGNLCYPCEDAGWGAPATFFAVLFCLVGFYFWKKRRDRKKRLVGRTDTAIDTMRLRGQAWPFLAVLAVAAQTRHNDPAAFAVVVHSE